MATRVSKVQECPIVMGSSDHFTLNTECGNKGIKLKSCLLLVLLLLSLFRSCHVMNERLKPEDSKQVN